MIETEFFVREPMKRNHKMILAGLFIAGMLLLIATFLIVKGVDRIDEIAGPAAVAIFALYFIVPFLLDLTMYVPGMILEKDEPRAFVRPYFFLIGCGLYSWGCYLLVHLSHIY